MRHERQEHHSRCPVVAKEVTSLAEVVVGDAVPSQAAFFEREVTWLREAEATLVLRHSNGEDLKVGATHCDHYGFLTSLREIVPMAREWTRRFEAAPGSILEVVVLLTVEDRPFEDGRVVDSPSPMLRMRFLGFPRGLVVARDRDLAVRWVAGGFEERDALLPSMEFLAPRKVVDGRVVWSSRNAGSPLGERALWDGVVAEAVAGVPEPHQDKLARTLSEAFEAAAAED